MSDEAEREAAGPADLPDLMSDFELIHRASRDEPFPAARLRLDRIARLVAMTEEAEERIADAIDADYGGRARFETKLAEVSSVIAAGAYARRRLAGWMKTRPARTAVHFRPMTNSVLPQPLGVVGVLSPWNYPWHLATAPLIGIFAAGNRAMVKPSEHAPATSALLAELAERYFSPDELTVVRGGAGTAAAFSRLPFDHLLFTGSAEIGARVAAAAAERHVPVTLELGGKCPAIVDRSADLDQAATQIAWGKWLNAGQTCVAPDHVLVPDDLLAPLVQRLAAKVTEFYPPARIERDYTAIPGEHRRQRLAAMLQQAEDEGVGILRPLGPDRGPRMLPAIVTNPPEHLAMMQEEIFGPILPVVPCHDTPTAIGRLATRPRPLALYWFGTDRTAEAQVARETWAGGLSINTCVLQIAQEDLPFGGVGASGQGHYHGQWGFDRFSKLKPVTRRSGRFDPSRFFMPPYGPATRSAVTLYQRAARWRS